MIIAITYQPYAGAGQVDSAAAMRAFGSYTCCAVVVTVLTQASRRRGRRGKRRVLSDPDGLIPDIVDHFMTIFRNESQILDVCGTTDAYLHNRTIDADDHSLF